MSAADLAGRIIGCADGPASFNAEATRQGHCVISCDPLYRFSARQIRHRIDATYGQMMEQTHRNRHEFHWTYFKSPEHLGRARMAAMERFLSDYAVQRSRYVGGELPSLPFADQSFDLALCSSYLFLYSQLLTEAFHVSAIHEMLRTAKEARNFPLVALGSGRSCYVSPVAEKLQTFGYRVSIERVDYEFKRGANQMMRVQRSKGVA